MLYTTFSKIRNVAFTKVLQLGTISYINILEIPFIPYTNNLNIDTNSDGTSVYPKYMWCTFAPRHRSTQRNWKFDIRSCIDALHCVV